jgi:hypothetical protein
MLKEHYAGKLFRCAMKSKVGDVSFTASADDRPMTDISRRIAAEILSPSLVCIIATAASPAGGSASSLA